MPINARDAAIPTTHSILAVGEPGSGKSAQIATLPGKKFVYAFDPGTLRLLSTRKIDADVEEFLPDVATVDFTLKGFNKNSKDDRPKKSIEPTAYTAWEAHFNDYYDKKLFAGYDWIIIDSLTLFSNAMSNRLLYLNNRFGDVMELSDYRVLGNKLGQVFTAIASMKINLYVTGHVQTFQDEKTNRITTQIGLPGAARDMLPKLFSNIWLLQASTDEKQEYTMLTRPEPRGLQTIRTVLPDLQPRENLTIVDWSRPEDFGIGAILSGKRRTAASGSVQAAKPTGATSSLIRKPSPAQGAAAEASPQPAPETAAK